MADMTDQELKDAFEKMSREDFENLLKEQKLVLVPDCEGINGESAEPMYYAESHWSVPVRERRSPLLLDC